MAEKKTILVVEENATNRKILCKILDYEYGVLGAESGDQAFEILNNKKKEISLVLFDFVASAIDGYAFLKRYRSIGDLATIPVVVVVQGNSENDVVKALSSGAVDFFTKPYKPQIIKYRVAKIINMCEMTKSVNNVENDMLTGLYTKEAFNSRARDLMQKNADKQYDVVCMDIENFKLVNDMYGELEGDKLLCFVSDCFKRIIHSNGGYAGRLGSDVFVGILPWIGQNYQVEMVNVINETLASYPLNMKIVVKFGIYQHGGLTLTIRAMCDRAKLAVESIKGKYDVLFTFYNEEIGSRLQEEQQIASEMKQALEEKQFQIYFQPKYNLHNDKIAGAEALVRWVHPQKGLMPPASFIPLFERNGFITDLDRYVWDNTCKKIREWRDKGYKTVPISVNVSRTDIYNPVLPDILIQTVSKHGLTPEELHLEITETSYTENPKQIIHAVEHLKSLGFVIEMDDFGSGYSSLNMLNELPIDILKLDMKFIQNDSDESNNKNILSFIISLAKWLDLLVVAEGVETFEQVQRLRNMDCTYVQGYYYAKPMPSDDFEHLLKNSKVDDEEVSTDVYFDTGKIEVSHTKGQKKTMLIVDDIEINRAVLVETFKEKYTTVEADNGAVALEYLNGHHEEIEIVLLDLIMPVVDGFQLLCEMRKNENTKLIPVIITSQAGENSEVKSLSMGASDFIAKPYDRCVCIRRVENVVAKAKLMEQERKLRPILNSLSELLD
ncbi:MAG: EAL domain-containing protein [Lachnospiraceae bacterium]|nr:EAL domain-containing protein [Lachnospiraceae bacterium]